MRAARPDFSLLDLFLDLGRVLLLAQQRANHYVARPVTYVHLPMTACLSRSASVACEVKQRRAKSCPALPRLVPPSSNNKAVDGSFVPPSSPTQGSGAGRGWPQLAQGPACKLQPSLQEKKKWQSLTPIRRSALATPGVRRSRSSCHVRAMHLQLYCSSQIQIYSAEPGTRGAMGPYPLTARLHRHAEARSPVR